MGTLKPLPTPYLNNLRCPSKSLYSLEQTRQIQRDVIEVCMEATDYLSIKELLKEIPE